MKWVKLEKSCSFWKLKLWKFVNLGGSTVDKRYICTPLPHFSPYRITWIQCTHTVTHTSTHKHAGTNTQQAHAICLAVFVSQQFKLSL